MFDRLFLVFEQLLALGQICDHLLDALAFHWPVVSAWLPRRSYSGLPGAAILRWRSASIPAGVILAIADCSLFCQPLTTSPSPLIMASKPVFATSAGSSFFSVPTLVSIMSARSKKSVSVAPGIRQVTVTPLSLSSA